MCYLGLERVYATLLSLQTVAGYGKVPLVLALK